MLPLPRLQTYLLPRVTLTFDLLTLKVDHFMPLLHGPLVPKSFCFRNMTFTILVTDERIDREPENMTPLTASLAWWRHETDYTGSFC